MFTTDLVNLYNRNIFKTSLYIFIFQDEKCRLMRNLSLSMLPARCLKRNIHLICQSILLNESLKKNFLFWTFLGPGFKVLVSSFIFKLVDICNFLEFRRKAHHNAVVYKNIVYESCATLWWSFEMSKENNMFKFRIYITRSVLKERKIFTKFR